MSNTTTDSIVSKIRKLLNLAKSTNAFEAALAAQRASELMEKYQIDHVTEAAEEVRRDGVVEVVRQCPQFSKTCHWALTVASACAKLFDGRTYYYAANNHGGKFRIAWVGMPSDVEAMQALFDHPIDAYESSVAAARKEHRAMIDPSQWSPAYSRRFGLHFGMGYSSSIFNRVVEVLRDRKARVSATETGKALIVLKDNAVADHMKKKRLRSGGGSSVRGAYGSAGYDSGRTAGNNVALSPHRLS